MEVSQLPAAFDNQAMGITIGAVTDLVKTTRAAWQDREYKKDHAAREASVQTRLEELTSARTAGFQALKQELEQKADTGEMSLDEIYMEGTRRRLEIENEYNTGTLETYSRAYTDGASNPYSKEVYKTALDTTLGRIQQQGAQQTAQYQSEADTIENTRTNESQERQQAIGRGLSVWKKGSDMDNRVNANDDFARRSESLVRAVAAFDPEIANSPEFQAAFEAGPEAFDAFLKAQHLNPNSIVNIASTFDIFMAEGGKEGQAAVANMSKKYYERIKLKKEEAIKLSDADASDNETPEEARLRRAQAAVDFMDTVSQYAGPLAGPIPATNQAAEGLVGVWQWLNGGPKIVEAIDHSGK